MTYIISVKTEESILMSSDTRLNYFNDKIINGEKYQEIVAVADCMRKTFFIYKAKIGIQFLGIGYFSDTDGERYPLSHFIKKIEDENYSNDFEDNTKVAFSFLQSISQQGDTGQYIKGAMYGFGGDNKPTKSYICIFNTFDNTFEIKEISVGQFMDSENDKTIFPYIEAEAIQEINRRINEVAKQKYWNIGGPIEILKITPKEAVFIQENTKLFNGTQKELVHYFNNDISKINGSLLQEPHLEKYTF